MPGDLSEQAPPDPIPNSDVKLFCANDTLGFPHGKVGHCQATVTYKKPANSGFFVLGCLNYSLEQDNDISVKFASVGCGCLKK